MIDVYQLSEEELNVLVAKALGLEVVGKAKCFSDYECGYLDISIDQDCGEDHYVFLNNCACEAFHNVEKKYENNNDIDGYCWEPPAKIHGHYTSCLSPVLDYCTDWNIGGPLIMEHDISIGRLFYVSNKNQYWGATMPGFHFEYGDPESRLTTGPTPLIAAMRSLVKYKFEHKD